MDAVHEPVTDPKHLLRRENGHVHPHQEERFEILAGSVRILIGDRDVVLQAGQTAVVPPNTVHHWMALGGEPVHLKAEFRPVADSWRAEEVRKYAPQLDRASSRKRARVVRIGGGSVPVGSRQRSRGPRVLEWTPGDDPRAPATACTPWSKSCPRPKSRAPS